MYLVICQQLYPLLPRIVASVSHLKVRYIYLNIRPLCVTSGYFSPPSPQVAEFIDMLWSLLGSSYVCAP